MIENDGDRFKYVTKKCRFNLDQTNLGLFGWHLFLNEKTQRQMGCLSDGLSAKTNELCSAQRVESVWCRDFNNLFSAVKHFCKCLFMVLSGFLSICSWRGEGHGGS